MGAQEIAMVGGAIVLLIVVTSAVAWVKSRTSRANKPTA